MAVAVPYVREMDFQYGKCVDLSPNIRRVIANNPSAFTYMGTGTYILGRDQVAVIDPGPLDENHIQAILDATSDEEIQAVLITHTHMDHSPGIELLKQSVDVESYGYGPHGAGKNTDDEVVVEEGGDMNFTPDNEVRQGDVLEIGGMAIECVYTPGHTSNHMCYRLQQDQTLFTGDHVMGWSTSVISPPDGDMADYMASLNLLLGADDSVYWPTHGPSITDPKRHVKAFIAHREERESQILAQLKQGRLKIEDMVPDMYRDVDQRLHPAAARSVFAAMVYLVQRGVVKCDGEPAQGSTFYLN